MWAPDKQAKVFSNSFSILLSYSITKFKKFDSAVCMTQWSQNFKPSKWKKISFKSFLSWLLKGFLLIVPLRSTRKPSKIFILTPQCTASAWLRGTWLRYMMHTLELDFAKGCTPRSLTLRWDAHCGVLFRYFVFMTLQCASHCGVRLLGVHPSTVWCTLGSLTPRDDAHRKVWLCG